jgi:flagellar biosynthesis protein FlhB
MKEDGRFIPPGPGRAAAFARRGGFGKSSLLAAGSGLLGACAALYIFRDRFYSGLVGAFRLGIDNAINNPSSPVDSIAISAESFFQLLIPVSISIFAAAFFGAVLPAMAARRGKGATAVPLPKIPQARLTTAAVRLFGAGLFVAGSLLAVRQTRLDVLSPTGWIGEIGALCLRVLAVLGSVLVLVGMAEILILRHQIFQALFLNRSEARREIRGQQGSREAASRSRRRAQQETSQ